MIHYQEDRVTVHHADCLAVIRGMPDCSVDSVVTDPPYGLSNTDPKHVVETITRWVTGDRDYVPAGAGFMSAKWDAFVPPPAVWDECLRVLKPGGHALVFSSSRTTDLMTLSLRMAGFEIRDSIAWIFGGAMPKSLDVSKAIDKAAGATRTVIGENPYNARRPNPPVSIIAQSGYPSDITAPATDAAKRWEGWGTGLRPSMELVCVARKPFEGTVAANVQEHGTGALNIDGCRIATADDTSRNLHLLTSKGLPGGGYGNPNAVRPRIEGRTGGASGGRWPPNVVLDDAAAAQLDHETGATTSALRTKNYETDSAHDVYGALKSPANPGNTYGDTGGPSRFFPVMKYQAKAPQKERPSYTDATGRKISHSTVKPVTLMKWLVRLVTPPGGLVCDPFAGSGSTLEAALLEGFRAVGVEQEAAYLPLIMTRVERAHTATAAAELDDVPLFDLDDEAVV